MECQAVVSATEKGSRGRRSPIRGGRGRCYKIKRDFLFGDEDVKLVIQ